MVAIQWTSSIHYLSVSLQQRFVVPILLCLVGLFDFPLLHAKGVVRVVSVGISDYQCVKDLRLPQQDAKSVASYYRYALGEGQAEVHLLTNQQATKERILQLLRTTFKQANKEDVVLFFFSGHGFQAGFCTYDTNCGYGKYITYDELKQIYKESKAERKMIFADACYSGAFRGEKKQKASASSSFSNQHVLLFLSSRTDEVSMERADMKNGYFTTFLLSGLKGKADQNNDRIVTAKELFTYVNKEVKAISNDRQHPVMWGKFSDNLILMDNRKE